MVHCKTFAEKKTICSKECAGENIKHRWNKLFPPCYNADMKQQPIMRLIGELRPGGADWDLAGYRALFEKLGTTAATGTVTRYVRYFGESGGHTEVRFFGIASDSIKIPEGMIALELSNDTMTVLEPNGQAAWQGHLTWDWLNRSVPGAPVGEFKARVPEDWTSQSKPPLIEFALTANAYFEKGKSSDDDVRLAEYDPRWPAKFEEMADWLRKTIPPQIARRIEHFGSTAIPDMPAKPIIDILLDIPSFKAGRRALIPIFNKPECEYWLQDGDIEIIVRKEFMGTRTHHIHAAPGDSPLWVRLAFRDYLRTHPDDAKRYAALKHELAARHATDREEYTIAKSSFIKETTGKALRAAGK